MRLQVLVKLARTEKVSPLSSLPRNIQFFLRMAIGLIEFSALLLSMLRKPVSAYRSKLSQLFKAYEIAFPINVFGKLFCCCHVSQSRISLSRGADSVCRIARRCDSETFSILLSIS